MPSPKRLPGVTVPPKRRSPSRRAAGIVSAPALRGLLARAATGRDRLGVVVGFLRGPVTGRGPRGRARRRRRGRGGRGPRPRPGGGGGGGPPGGSGPGAGGGRSPRGRGRPPGGG